MIRKTKIFILSAVTLLLATSCGPSQIDAVKAKEVADDIVIQIDGNKVTSPNYATINTSSNINDSLITSSKEIYNGIDCKYYFETTSTLQNEGVTVKTEVKHWVYKLDGFIYHSEFSASIAGTEKKTTKEAYETDTDAIKLFQDKIYEASPYNESLNILNITKQAADSIIEFIDNPSTTESEDTKVNINYKSSGKGSLLAEVQLTLYEEKNLKGEMSSKTEIENYLVKSQSTNAESVDGEETIIANKTFDYGKNKIELPSLEEYPLQ